MREGDRSLLDLEGATPLQSLVGFALLTACAFSVHPERSDWRYVILAFLIFAGGAGVASIGARRGGWLLIVPAIAALAAIAALRESQGGASSGYSPLAMLAVVWVALTLDRRALLAITACTGLMFALPLALIGGPTYPSTGWRGAFLFTFVAFVVGEVVHRSATHMRMHADDAERRAEELEEMQLAFAAIARVARDVALGTEARELVCAAALASLDATLGTVVEPQDDGSFTITGSAGLPLERAEIRRVEPLASLQAFQTGQRVFIPDASEDPRVSPAITHATGVVSAVFEPILRDGASVGVLAVGWSTRRDTLDAKTDAILRVLATEAGAAVERADLLAQLDGLARSDPLTGLPNRRTWDEAIASAMRDGEPLCVAMIDLDHFKRFNDEFGHAAGDRLLKACAAAWRSHLRAEDILARVGGEEFAVLLPRCAIEDASEVLERLRRATPRGATASVGVAEIQLDEDAPSLLARADVALYEAKASGRDQLLAAA